MRTNLPYTRRIIGTSIFATKEKLYIATILIFNRTRHIGRKTDRFSHESTGFLKKDFVYVFRADCPRYNKDFCRRGRKVGKVADDMCVIRHRDNAGSHQKQLSTRVRHGIRHSTTVAVSTMTYRWRYRGASVEVAKIF